MKPTQAISAFVLGALVLAPMLSFAQTETNTGMSAEASSHVVTPPRDTASGLPTGKRTMATNTKMMPAGMDLRNKMMASGTKPLPRGMEERMENRDDMRARMMNGGSSEKRGAEMREKMMERRGEILKRIADKMIVRLNAAVDRLTKLADRADSRIAKLKERGADMSKAEANIAITRTKITEAKAAINAALGTLDTAVIQANVSASTTKPSDPGKIVRTSLQKARESVFAAHKALVTAIASIKATGGLGEGRENATGTKPFPKPKPIHATTTTSASGTVAQ